MPTYICIPLTYISLVHHQPTWLPSLHSIEGPVQLKGTPLPTIEVGNNCRKEISLFIFKRTNLPFLLTLCFHITADSNLHSCASHGAILASADIAPSPLAAGINFFEKWLKLAYKLTFY